LIDFKITPQTVEARFNSVSPDELIAWFETQMPGWTVVRSDNGNTSDRLAVRFTPKNEGSTP